MSHPRLSLRTSLGDRAVSPGTPGPIGTHVVRDRRVSPYLVPRSATTDDGMGEQARSVNLLGSRTRGGVRGATPWLTVNTHRRIAKFAVDKTVGSSLTVLGSCRETGVSLGIHGIANDWVTDRSLILRSEWLNVQSGHSEGSLRWIRAVLHWDWGH